MFLVMVKRLYSLVVCALCLLCAGCLAPRSIEVRGHLHGDLVWQGEVLVAGDVVLEEDVRLTILPGTRIRFLPPETGEGGFVEHPHFPGSELIIKGQVHAVGTPLSPIRFEAVSDAAEPGFWGAVNLVASKEAVFEYCVFRQADSALHSWDSNVYVEQSVFDNNLVGVRFNSSDILIENNLFRNNHTGIRFHFGAPVICENEFTGNRVNLFVTSHPRDYRIENNSFGVPADYHVVLGEEVPEDVDLSHNYWMFERTAVPDKAFYDGRRSPYLGKVMIEPQKTSPAPKTGLSWNP